MKRLIILRSEISIKHSLLAPWLTHPNITVPISRGVRKPTYTYRVYTVLFLLEIYTVLSGFMRLSSLHSLFVGIHVFFVNSSDHFETLYSILPDQVSRIFYKAVLIEGYLIVTQFLWSVDYCLSMQNGE